MIQDKGRWVFAVAFLLSPIAAGAALVWLRHPAPEPEPVVLGRQGEWVTRPDGRRVCRLRYDLTIYNAISTGFCEDWREPEPKFGQPVEGWMRANPAGTGHQIMIEGNWKP